jgi:hypothetical protein
LVSLAPPQDKPSEGPPLSTRPFSTEPDERTIRAWCGSRLSLSLSLIHRRCPCPSIERASGAGEAVELGRDRDRDTDTESEGARARGRERDRERERERERDGLALAAAHPPALKFSLKCDGKSASPSPPVAAQSGEFSPRSPIAPSRSYYGGEDEGWKARGGEGARAMERRPGPRGEGHLIERSAPSFCPSFFTPRNGRTSQADPTELAFLSTATRLCVL